MTAKEIEQEKAELKALEMKEAEERFRQQNEVAMRLLEGKK